MTPVAWRPSTKKRVGRTGQSALAPARGAGKKKGAQPRRSGSSRSKTAVRGPPGHTRKLADGAMGNGRPGQERDRANFVTSWPFCRLPGGTPAPFTKDETEAQAVPRCARSPPRGGGRTGLPTPALPAPPPSRPAMPCGLWKGAGAGPARPAGAVLTARVGSEVGGSGVTLKRKSRD